MSLLKSRKEASLLLQFLNLPRQNHQHLSPSPHQSPRQSLLLRPDPHQSLLLRPDPHQSLLQSLRQSLRQSLGPRQRRLEGVRGLKEENLLELIRRRSSVSVSLAEPHQPRCHAPRVLSGTLRSAYAIGLNKITLVLPSAFFLDHHHYHHLYDP